MSDPESNSLDRIAALVVAGVASFLTPFMGSSINVALPSIVEEFSMNAVMMSWVATSYLLAAAMFLVPFGKIADIYGRRKIFIYGISVYTVSSLLLGMSNSTGMLIGLRVVQGIGGAMIFGTAVAILTSIFPPGERGKALGINTAATYLGLSLGPYLGGLLTEHLGWRSLFLANVPLGIIVIVLVLLMLRGEWKGAKGDKFDLTGSVLYGLSLVAIMLGFPRLPEIWGISLLVAGLIGIAAFVYWESAIEHPVLNMNLFRNNTVFAFSNMAAFINYSATFAVTFLLSLYLQYVKGFSPETAGLILVSQPVVMTVFSPAAGWLSDRLEARIVASAGMALMVVGLALLSLVGTGTSTAFIAVCLVILGFGYALFSSPNTNAVMSSVEKTFFGVAAATLATMRLVGQTLSMGIATLIMAVYIGNAQIEPSNHPQFLAGMKTALIVFCVLCFIGMFASLARGRTHLKVQPSD